VSQFGHTGFPAIVTARTSQTVTLGTFSIGADRAIGRFQLQKAPLLSELWGAALSAMRRAPAFLSEAM